MSLSLAAGMSANGGLPGMVTGDRGIVRPLAPYLEGVLSGLKSCRY